MEEIKPENQRGSTPDFEVAYLVTIRRTVPLFSLPLLASPIQPLSRSPSLFLPIFTLTGLATGVTMGSPMRGSLSADLSHLGRAACDPAQSKNRRSQLEVAPRFDQPHCRPVVGLSLKSALWLPHRPALPQSVGRDPEALPSDAARGMGLTSEQRDFRIGNEFGRDASSSPSRLSHSSDGQDFQWKERNQHSFIFRRNKRGEKFLGTLSVPLPSQQGMGRSLAFFR